MPAPMTALTGSVVSPAPTVAAVTAPPARLPADAWVVTPRVGADWQAPRAPAWPGPVWFLFIYLAVITIIGKGPTYLGVPPFYWGEITLVALAAWIYGRSFLRLPGPRRRWPAMLTFLIVVFVAQGGVQMFLGYRRYREEAIRDSALWYYAAFFFIGGYVGAFPAWANLLWTRLQWVWLAALAWYALNDLTGNFLVFASPTIPWRGVPLLSSSGSELVQHVALAVFLLVLSPAGVRRLRFRGVVFALGILAGLYLVFTAPGRGVKVAVMVSFLVGFLASLGGRAPIWPFSRMFAAGSVVSLSVLLVAIYIGPQGLAASGRLDRFVDITENAGTARWRLVWWQRLHNAVQTRDPFYGVGFGESLSRYNPHLQADVGPWQVRSPHNVNVTIYARMGTVGAAIWGSILVFGLGGLIVAVRRNRNRFGVYTTERRKELTFWLVMLFATWVNATFGLLMEGPVLGVWFWFALGFAYARANGGDGVRPRLS